MLKHFRIHTFIPLLLLFLLGTGFADVTVNRENARLAMDAKDWATANYEWRQVLLMQPEDLEAKVRLSQSLTNTGFYEEAIGLLEGIPENKRPEVANLTLARDYEKTGSLLKSRNTYIRMLVKNPYDANALSELKALEPKLTPGERKAIESNLNRLASDAKAKGEQALAQGKFPEAAKYYQMAAAQLKTVGLINDYGIILLLAGDYKQAHEQFKLLAIKNKLGFSEVNSNASIASLSVGNLAQAKKEILEAINGAPSNALKAELYNNMGFILEMSRKRTEAKFAYQHALQLDPNLLTARKNLAYVLQANQDYDEAVTEYQKILRTHPKEVELWNRLGFVYEMQYKSKLALSAYKHAIVADPKHTDSYYNLAMLYKKLDRMKEANDTLMQMMQIGYAEIEAPKTAVAAKSETPVLEKNPLKYVVLFPANPKVTSKLQ